MNKFIFYLKVNQYLHPFTSLFSGGSTISSNSLARGSLREVLHLLCFADIGVHTCLLKCRLEINWLNSEHNGCKEFPDASNLRRHWKLVFPSMANFALCSTIPLFLNLVNSQFLSLKLESCWTSFTFLCTVTCRDSSPSKNA